MKQSRVILALLYLLLMVLAPHWHLTLHAPGSSSISDHPPCSHTSGSDHSPAGKHSEEHDHDSCLLCRLMTTPADTPQVCTVIQSVFTVAPAFTEPKISFSPSVRITTKARAPPFATV